MTFSTRCSGSKLAGALSSLLSGAGGQATPEVLLNTVCRGVIADCELLLRLVQPANLSPATRLRSGTASNVSTSAAMSFDQTTKVGPAHVVKFFSRRLDALHQWVVAAIDPNAPQKSSSSSGATAGAAGRAYNYKHLAKLPPATGAAASTSRLWCEAEDVRRGLLAQCHKGGLRVYALNTFDALVASLTLPQQVRLILMRLLESLSASWRALTGRQHRDEKFGDSQPQSTPGAPHHQHHTGTGSNKRHHAPGVSGTWAGLGMGNAVGPTLMHHLDGLGGCGLALERCVTSACVDSLTATAVHYACFVMLRTMC